MRFVETNIFLYVITANPTFGPTAKKILGRIEDGEEAATSSLVIAEVCIWLEYHKMMKKIPPFLSMLESYPTILKIDTEYRDLLDADKLGLAYPQLGFYDRVYLAQMLRIGISEIYSNDAGFDRVKGAKRVFT